MMDAYSSVGMPIGYHHWSFGRNLSPTEQHYKRGQMGLAYEIVINSDPCNRLFNGRKQHHHYASVGDRARLLRHNSFSKNNYLFKTGPMPVPSLIIWCLPVITSLSAKKNGIDEVESLLTLVMLS